MEEGYVKCGSLNSSLEWDSGYKNLLLIMCGWDLEKQVSISVSW